MWFCWCVLKYPICRTCYSNVCLHLLCCAHMRTIINTWHGPTKQLDVVTIVLLTAVLQELVEAQRVAHVNELKVVIVSRISHSHIISTRRHTGALHHEHVQVVQHDSGLIHEGRATCRIVMQAAWWWLSTPLSEPSNCIRLCVRAFNGSARSKATNVTMVTLTAQLRS